MLCWLAFGEHEALKRYMKRIGILSPAEGIPTSTSRVHDISVHGISVHDMSVYDMSVYDISVYV